MKSSIFIPLLISLILVTTVLSELIIITPDELQPRVIDELPDPSTVTGAFVLEGNFEAIAELPPENPLYVVEKWFIKVDDNGTDVVAMKIIALMHNFDHVLETKAKARLNPGLILVTLHPAKIRDLKATFPDREIIEVMPDPSDTRRRAGNPTYTLKPS